MTDLQDQLQYLPWPWEVFVQVEVEKKYEGLNTQYTVQEWELLQAVEL